jgi:hypothetical protein
MLDPYRGFCKVEINLVLEEEYKEKNFQVAKK